MINRGFTLTELMVVLFLSAVVLMFAVPSYGPHYQQQRARTIALSLINCYQYSRIQARLLSEPLVLVPLNGKNQFDEGVSLLKLRDAQKKIWTNPIHQWTWNTHHQLTIQWQGARSKYPIISPRLNDAMMNGHFDIKGKHTHQRMIVNRLGRARVEDLNAKRQEQ